MKIRFITITCEKYHDTRVKKIRETWGQSQDVLFLSDMNIGDDIVGYDYLKRGYENIWLKYSEFLKNHNDDFTHDWYFFTDDDTFVNVPNIEKLLEKYDVNSSICIGHVGKLNPNGTDMDGNQTGFPLHTIIGNNVYLPLTYVSGGAGFILSRKAMQSICKYIKLERNIPGSYNSDVTFGFWARNAGINIIDIKGFWWTNPTELKHNDVIFNYSYTYHYVNETMMEEMYKKINQK